MEKQLIISVGREFGSCGHKIAEFLAKKFNLDLYDKNLLEEIATEKELNPKHLEKYDEAPRNPFITRNVRGLSNSFEEHLANMQFDILRKKAENGESFVVVGRCSESVLKDYPALVSIFILGDKEHKLQHLAESYHLSLDEAETFMNRQNRKRKHYHNFYTKGKWGDSRNYDITINSSKLGEELTAEILAEYIIKRQNLL